MIYSDSIITCELDFSVEVVDLWRSALSVQVEATVTERETGAQHRQAVRQTDCWVPVQGDSPECVDTVDGPRHVLFVVDIGCLRVEDLEKHISYKQINTLRLRIKPALSH